MKRTMTALAAMLAAAALGAGPATAHDFWIEPSDFDPEPGATVRLGLRVGEAFEGKPVRRSSRHLERFVAVDDSGETAIRGFEGRDPAGLFRMPEGPVAIVYDSARSSIELEADRFEDYLVSEGLESIVEARRAAGDSDEPGREVFSRCAKTLLGDPQDRVTGLPLELVLESHATDEATFRLLHEGAALPGVLVVAYPRAEPDLSHRARTDPSGSVTLPLGLGEWLVKAVHMVPAPEDADADWESLWASLTFRKVG